MRCCIRFNLLIACKRSNVIGCIKSPESVLSLDRATNVHPAAISLSPISTTALSLFVLVTYVLSLHNLILVVFAVLIGYLNHYAIHELWVV